MATERKPMQLKEVTPGERVTAPLRLQPGTGEDVGSSVQRRRRWPIAAARSR